MPIPGTKLAVNNTQLLISSGIPYFDELVGNYLEVMIGNSHLISLYLFAGGGLAVGTVNLIGTLLFIATNNKFGV